MILSIRRGKIIRLLEDVLQSLSDDLTPQSGLELSHSPAQTPDANVAFMDHKAGVETEVHGKEDPTRTLTDTPEVSLDKFFQRPIKIDTFVWSVGGFLDRLIYPWESFMGNARVVNRLTTYALMRSKLHLKIVVNGNGFYYGRAMASYTPFFALDALTTLQSEGDLTGASQRPKMFINPTQSMGGEMVIPFHHYHNNFDVTNFTDDFRSMGSLWIRSLTNLLHANGSTGSVTVTIFAWLEDVELHGLTSYDNDELVTQSGKEVDTANEKGIVSGPASAVARAAGKLKGLPYISNYARATETAASAVAGVASTLGYCRPVETKAPEPYRPTAVSSLANTNVPDVTNKLTVDHKQELTIDPIVAGCGMGDSMSIQEIASRESLFWKFDWQLSDPVEGLLGSIRVDPCHWQKTSFAYNFPATAAAALPFKYWTGTLKFRFQVVCSNFHKGRLKFVYDPYSVQENPNNYNTNFVQIVDIAESTDFTIAIKPGQTTTWLEHALPGITTTASMRDTTNLNRASNMGNGVLNCYVLNELTAPNPLISSDIKIVVYISAGEDFQVANPSDYFQHFVFAPQSGFEPQSGNEPTGDQEETEEINMPELEQYEIMGQSNPIPLKTDMVFMGESITSFRPILKRYNRWTAFGPTDYPQEISITANAFPYLRGNVPGAVDSTSTLAAYNYANTLVMHWVTAMFSGWRGSIRYKMIPYGTEGPSTTFVTRLPFGAGYNYDSRTPQNNLTKSYAPSKVVYDDEPYRLASGPTGCTYATSDVNGIVEWEMPYYNRNRFYPGKVSNWTQAMGGEIEAYAIDIVTNTGRDNTDFYERYELWAAVGEDFQTFFFTGLPRMYYEASPPAAF